MGLFHFGKEKKNEKTTTENCCCCGGSNTASCDCTDIGAELQSMKVLGSGCKSCHEMYENAKKALENIGSNMTVEYVTDMEKIMAYGVMSMPGLVINEQVVSMGKVLKAADIEELLHKYGF